MKRLSVYFIAAFLPALVWLAGCSDPKPQPLQEQSTYWDGIELTQADISGQNPRIELKDQPYIVRSDLVIDPGVELTIDAGVTLMFSDEDSLLWVKILGTLKAVGAPNNPITFTTARRRADYGQWRGLAFLNETDASEIKFCIFEYGAYFEMDTLTLRGKEAQLYAGMLAILNSSPIIKNNIIFYNGNNGIYVTGNNARPTIRYNIIFKNDASAIRADTSTYENLVPRFNCGAENSSLDFLLADSRYGQKIKVNENLDSTDHEYNFSLPPQFVDWENGDFHLQSCSPCIDAGPPDVPGPSGDNGRIDFGIYPYVKSDAELRGVVTGALKAETYRMSCHVRVPPGGTLTIPAGTIINVSDYYNFEIFGTLIINGTSANRVYIRSESETPDKGDWGVLSFRYSSALAEPSQVAYATFEDFDYAEVMQPGATFTGCIFRNSFDWGLAVVTYSDDGSAPVLFDHCQFDDLGVYGLWVLWSSIIVRNSLIENCIGDGIHFVGWPSEEDKTSQLYNNIIHNCGVNGIVCETFMSPEIINNVITGVGYAGIQCYRNSNPLILNNIISECGRPGIIARESSFPDIDYNDVWGNNTAGDSVVNYEGYRDFVLQPGPHDISFDPKFAMETLYELGGDSPCINKGDPNPDYNDTDETRNNMGAYGGPSGGQVGP